MDPDSSPYLTHSNTFPVLFLIPSFPAKDLVGLNHEMFGPNTPSVTEKPISGTWFRV